MEYSYPKGEVVWVSYFDEEHNLRYIITSKASREFYFVYEFNKKGFVKLGKSKNPRILEETYIKL